MLYSSLFRIKKGRKLLDYAALLSVYLSLLEGENEKENKAYPHRKNLSPFLRDEKKKSLRGASHSLKW